VRERHVVVSGGRGALGEGVVAVLEERGMIVHVPPREVRFDDEAAVTAYFKDIAHWGLWGSVHLVGGFAMGPITETSLADFEAQHRINTVTCFLACREAVRVLREAGGGRIVNVASRAAVTPSPNMAAYVASKGAIVALTQSLAAEVAKDNILVNAVLPSIIDTPANRAAMPKADHAAWPSPRAIGEAIAFLVSDDNALTSGALVPVYGKA
jgi:NAD(P)-dependent dehydrogenase (short-subunit alcohol dehydrogenase family)